MIQIISGPYWIGSALLSPSLDWSKGFDSKEFEEQKALRACIQEQLYAQMMGWA